MVEVLRYLFAVRGAPEFIRSDNGPEFASNAVKKWLKASDVETLEDEDFKAKLLKNGLEYLETP